MTYHQPDSGTPSDDPVTKKQTDTRRSKGGNSSGSPPSYPVATGLEDWKRPFGATESRSREGARLCDLFGIDFGEETTRIAGLNAGAPLLVAPSVIASTISYAAEAESWEAQAWSTEIGMLRTRLRLNEHAMVNGRVIEADQLVTQFFQRIYEILRTTTAVERPRIVLTVPSYYCSEERKELVLAVEAGGFKVIELLNDYAAPVLSFVRRGPSRWGNILIVTLGATSLSAAVLYANKGSVYTKSADSNANFGGEQLMRDLLSRLQKKAGYDSGANQSADLIENVPQVATAIEALRAVAVSNQYSIPFADHCTMFRPEMIKFLREHLRCADDLIKSVIQSSEIRLDSIDYVLFNGRPTANELIRSVLSSFVPGRKIAVLNANRASCFGAALHASVLSGLNEIPGLHDIPTVHLVE